MAIESIVQKLEEFRERFDRAYEKHPAWSSAWLVAAIAFWILLLPLCIIAYFKDICEATAIVSTNVLATKWLLATAIVLLWLAITIFTAIRYWPTIKMCWRLRHLSIYFRRHGLPKLGREIVLQEGNLISTWQDLLGDSIPPRAPRGRLVAWESAVTAMISGYAKALGDTRRGQHGSHAGHRPGPQLPLLPASFDLYAHCVESVRLNAFDLAKVSKQRKTVKFRTVLTPDIRRWYNVRSLILRNGQVFRCTTGWWEKYKRYVHTDEMVNAGACLLRLVRHDRTAGAPNQRNLYMLYIRAHPYEPLDQSTFSTGKALVEAASFWGTQKCEWQDGIGAQWPADQIPGLVSYAILCSDGSLPPWTSGDFMIGSLSDDFHTYHSGNQCLANEFSPGAFCKFIDRNAVQVPPGPDNRILPHYDDVFLIDFYQPDGPLDPVETFGIAFRTQAHTDTWGISLLPPAEIRQASTEFDAVWGDPNANPRIP